LNALAFTPVGVCCWLIRAQYIALIAGMHGRLHTRHVHCLQLAKPARQQQQQNQQG
jgi:hypothetical protein